MKLKEFISVIQKSPALRSVLPMNQGMLYPVFTVQRGQLCAYFLCHKSAVTGEGLLLWPGEYCVVYTYPQGQNIGIQDLKYHPAFREVDFSVPALLPNRIREEAEAYKRGMQKLHILADQLLEQWDASGNADTGAYREALEQVLTPEQMEAYRKLTGEE